MRYLFRTPGAERRVMHIARFSESGAMLDESLCGMRGFNRSINAPWGLGRPECKRCKQRLGKGQS